MVVLDQRILSTPVRGNNTIHLIAHISTRILGSPAGSYSTLFIAVRPLPSLPESTCITTASSSVLAPLGRLRRGICVP